MKSGGDCIVHEDAKSRPVEQPTGAEVTVSVATLPAAIGQPKAAPLPNSNAAPTLEIALWLLKTGQGEQLDSHYKSILASLLPLLEHADRNWSLNLQDSLKALRQRLGPDP